MSTRTHAREHEHVAALSAYLIGAGVLDPSEPDSRTWLAGLRAVPRHHFVPARAWAQPQDDRGEHLIDRVLDPAAWWDAVYSNTAIITQRGDGDADITDTDALPSSSLSCPHVAMEMLRLLDVADHHKLLEIGTGTGWTSAMLSWRLGDDQVVTVEVDPDVAAAAGKALAVAGHCPAIVVGDGVVGHPERAPYDRVHVTCGVQELPYAWVEQTRPGGVIVAPWTAGHGQWAELVRLDVLDDGTAAGRFRGGATFMMMRSQRTQRTWPAYEDDGSTSISRFDPRALSESWGRGFGLHLAATAPHVVVTSSGWEAFDGDPVWVMRLRGGDAWAIACVYPDRAEIEVTQGGATRLWDDLHDTYMGWLRAGQPGSDRYMLTVTPDGQRVHRR
ncbi:protein-L-isoaspartate(D-aspartate) O-methyltransferase [Sphaerisporangium sp. TRM90804]|uniref:protein-L-isoaspartate(D-aspartate) O-methyltransferase n=1 Tax=Sphaerisporangium sp. TRM90804 TaxID=3031113 RepID=UPI002447BE33|nr:protein-L-isoaspartate(D-aspartate) O-methyltransferase [Sphaerisporangium sp. TRM90804]MDH2424704.1 protein-L-isoaspartate(D-aspartate) O-methyltransferase [Sphaerisporangium sp. TRM90804]